MTTTENNFTAEVLRSLQKAITPMPALVGIVCHPRFAAQLRKEATAASSLPEGSMFACGVPIFEDVKTQTWKPFYSEWELREYLNRG